MSATQRTLVRDVIYWIAPKVGDKGACPTTEEGRQEIVENLDLACEALVKRIDSDGLLFNWYVPVFNNCIALPQECREVRYIVLNGVPLRQRDEWYVGKVASGRCENGCPPAECQDLGDFYIPQPLPKARGIRVALVAESDADAGKVCTVQVVNEYGTPVQEDVVLLGGQAPAVMNSVAYDVTFFKKVKTVGNVLLQLHYDNGQRFQHAVYHPDTEEGLFRRKAIPRKFYGCNVAAIKGKLRYVRITSEDQILPFNDRIALGNAVAAIAAWRRNDEAAYQALLASAVNELQKQMMDADSAKNVKQVVMLTQGATGSWATGRRYWN